MRKKEVEPNEDWRRAMASLLGAGSTPMRIEEQPRDQPPRYTVQERAEWEASEKKRQAAYGKDKRR